ncbi:MAG TPA: transcriptional regulator [Caulobacteraceae bacterium]
MTITIDTSALLGYFNARAGVSGASTAGTAASAAAKKTVPTAPWASESKAPRASDLVRSVLAGRKFVDLNAARLEIAGASQDYRKLFAAYQGLNALNGLAERAATQGVNAFELRELKAAFTTGMGEVSGFLDALKLDQLRLARGDSLNKASTAVGVKRDPETYVTDWVQSGDLNAAAPAFDGEVAFSMTVKRGTATTQVEFDLAEMGATSRSLPSVVSYLNGKLQAAGVLTRFAVERLPNEPRMVTVGGKAVTLPPGPDRFALKVKLDSTESSSFSTPATAPAVYLAQGAGEGSALQLLKFQAGASAPAPYVRPGESFGVEGRVFAKNLGPEIEAVRASATAPDGGVYLLADVSGPVEGQAIKGAGDVALLKYDSAGKLLFVRTLGAAKEASGLALAVSADGKVAVAGSVTGVLDAGAAGADAAKSDSFVTLFDAKGQELWTQRRGAAEADEASGVAFGADGAVYVTGRARSAVAGASGALGGWDSYLQGFSASGAAKFNVQFGTALDDGGAKLAVDGADLLVADVEAGRAVVRRYSIPNGGAPALQATRDLGSLDGGSIAGVSVANGEVIVAGDTRNGALSAGTVTVSHSGGKDAFVARLSSSLAAAGTDRLSYFGGAGDSSLTGMLVADGKAWLTGSAEGELPGLAKIGARDGYLVQLDPATGAVGWSRRFSAAGGESAPVALALDTGGSSVLDRLGLPRGAIGAPDSRQVVAATSVRAGDQFFVRTSEGGVATAVTVSAEDTLQSLASKISRAAGFRLQAKVVKDGAYDRLEVSSLNERSTLEIVAGKGGRDALEALGLSEGVVRTLKAGAELPKGEDKVYGLKLGRDLVVDTVESAKQASQQLQAALGVIRTAYRDLQAAAEPKSAAGQATGPAPAYLKSQIANYQAALNRLTGGG